MKSYLIHLIRHGQTEGNRLGQYIGVTDLDVTTEGIIELEELCELDIYPKLHYVYSSPLKRCIQTAETIYPSGEIITINNFIEYNFGEFEGKTAVELEENSDYIDWASGKSTRVPGGDDIHEFSARICLGLNEVVRHLSSTGDYEAAVIVHGGVIMTLLAACALPQRPLIEWACGNGRGYTIRITPSLYGRSGVVEIVGEIPPGGAAILRGAQ
ncbi:MAG: histidine phosphatase family protein [Oscillospiraceae bacterium]